MKRATSFKKVVLCHTNDFGGEKNDKIRAWVEANGATYSKEITTDVTHLVTSCRAWKKYHSLVKQARRMRTVRIVKYDWLEDSLMSSPIRALPEDKYLWEQTKLKSIKRAKASSRSATSVSVGDSLKKAKVPRDKRIEVAGVEFDKAKREFEEDMKAVGFHPYSDSTGFVYIVTLLRYDISRSRFDKYKLKVGHLPPSLPCEVVPGLPTILHFLPSTEPFGAAPIIKAKIPRCVKSSFVHVADPWAQSLQLYESDHEPHTYACYVQYTRPGVTRQVRVLAPPGSTWGFAWLMFQKFFKGKVGSAWHDRSVNGVEINLDSESYEHFYQYQPPRVGEPEGLRLREEGDRETGAENIETCEAQVEATSDGIDSNIDDTAGVPATDTETAAEVEMTPEIDDSHLP